MREPKKFVRKTKNRVHAISDIKGGCHCGYKVIYVSNDERRCFLILYAVPSFTVQCAICHFKSISSIFRVLSCSAPSKENTRKGKEEKSLFLIHMVILHCTNTITIQ